MWNLIKNDTKELIHKTERDSKILKTNLQLPKGKCYRGGWARHTHTIYKIISTKDLLYRTGKSTQILQKLIWENNLKKNGCTIRMTDSLCCAPEANTTL